MGQPVLGKGKLGLLRHFGSLKQVREASFAELTAVLPERVVHAVYAYFHPAPVA